MVWQDLVDSCIKANFGGIENLSLIPGTVGAAPIQNIGAYGVELKDTFEALEAIHLKSGEKKYFTREECAFGYRDSIFKKELKGQYLITNVVLRLSKEPDLNLEYGNLREVLLESGKKEYSIRDVSDAVIGIRQSKLPDPEVQGNAGSFFKNPAITQRHFKVLQKEYPQIPSYELPDDMVKVPAAWLIEQCGFKGTKHKGAAVHLKQPLVLINNEQAVGSDIVELSQMIQQKVKSSFSIELEPEVTII